MPVFVEDPSLLSKARLKSDLIAHNVSLPPAKSKKGVYLELHSRHVDQKNGGDFSSDDEEPDQCVNEEDPKNAEALDPSHLTDDDLKAALLQHGVKAGPIVASTRAVYERKLRNLLLSNGQGKSNGKQNGADEAALYSDSEKEEDSGEELEESGPEDSLSKPEPADQSQKDCKQNEAHIQGRCFGVSSRLRVCATEDRKPRPERNLRNVLKSFRQTKSGGREIPSGMSRASSIDQLSGLATGLCPGQQSAISNVSLISSQNFSITEMVEQIESRESFSHVEVPSAEFIQSTAQGLLSRSNGRATEMPVEEKHKTPNIQFCTPKAEAPERRRKEPVKETFQSLVADKNITPTGIYATCRRPIRGAAGRPVQYVHPDPPISPTTFQREEVDRRMVPLKIQILVFIIVAVTLYVIYVCVEDFAFNPLEILDALNQGIDTDETDPQEIEEFLELE